jgi:hypothetical protein
MLEPVPVDPMSGNFPAALHASDTVTCFTKIQIVGDFCITSDFLRFLTPDPIMAMPRTN